MTVIHDKLPSFSRGATYKLTCPEATIYVTITESREVIVSAGKAGGPAAGLADCMGRLITLALNDPNPSLYGIATVLEGSGHDRSDGSRFDALSIPDAISQAIVTHIVDRGNDD